jgi:antitoxin Phd
MRTTWQLQEAKSRFSEVVERALSDGPQVVTRHGEEAVVVVSIKQYKQLTRPRRNIFERYKRFAVEGPELDVTRDKQYPRDVDL